ncbi:hypothetical protein LTR53_016022 [Teratosphaeriaceae sp. CCFEE 6253]|nr:hypothetical protein LTR53_016022 [Teratosphaeriaceae sp. CCFEE 6253]
MSSRTRLAFHVPLSTKSPPDNLVIQITDPRAIAADNLALATWGSSQVLAALLHRLPAPDLTGTGLRTDIFPLLELGAGTGLVGLSAAAVWKTWACLTDLPPLLPQLQANVALNRDALARCGGAAAAGFLDWSAPDEHIFARTSDAVAFRARVILAADTVYSEEHPALLTQAVVARLERGPRARLVMCYPLRIGYLDHIRDLWQRLETAGLVCVQEGREMLEESWEEETPYEWCVWRWQDVGPPLQQQQRE